MKEFKLDQNIFHFAMMYCLHRQSVAPSVFIDNVKENIEHLTTQTLKFMLRDLRREFEVYDGVLGSKIINTPMWNEFNSYLESEIKLREGVE